MWCRAALEEVIKAQERVLMDAWAAVGPALSLAACNKVVQVVFKGCYPVLGCAVNQGLSYRRLSSFH